MRKILTLSSMTLLALALLSPSRVSVAAAQEDAPRISLEDAKKAYDDGTAFFIDSRPADGYKIEHIKGAVNITVDTLKDRLKDLPKDKTIIAYCT
jgi:rhodanese-related sulfurtransferase